MFRYVCAFFAKLAAYKPGGGGFRYVQVCNVLLCSGMYGRLGNGG
jgi:hypothetical protein